MRAITWVAALFELAAILPAQAVHVVDALAGPGTDFVSIGTAVNAAASGDVVLVRTGDYLEDVQIDGKSLVLQEDSGALATILTIEVVNLPSGGFVTVRGIDVRGGGVVQQPALRTFGCEGAVWFEDMTISGGPMAFFSGGGRCTNSDQVVFIRCHVEEPFNLPLPTLQLFDSSVILAETLVEGLDGAGGVFVTNPGEDAIEMTDGQLFLYGATVTGGRGGDGVGVCGAGAPGGAAVVMNGTSPTVRVLDSVVQGGAGGAGTGTCADGAEGEDFLQTAAGSTVETIAATARAYAVASPGRESALPLRVTFAGQPGDLVWVRYPQVPGPSLSSRFWDGPFLVGLPAPRQFIGTLDATGTLTQDVILPDLGPGVEAVTFHTQAIFLGSRFVMSTPSFLLALDESL